MHATDTAPFWNRTAPRYAKSTVADEDAYQKTLERTRAHLDSEMDVVELGCGTGTTASLLAGSVKRYTATDISQGMLTIARERHGKQEAANLTFRQASLFDLANEEKRYDAILAFNLLHLVDDLPGYLRGMRQLLAPDGMIVVKSPCLAGRPLFWLAIRTMQIFGKAPPVYFFTAKEFEAMLETAGFHIIERGDYPVKARSRFLVAQPRLEAAGDR